MGQPTVSIVVPTYNQPALLLETLRGVFDQTYHDFEVVVVNDGSTDDTAARLEAFRGTVGGPERLKVFDQPNGGIGVARNRGLELARGKYVALLDHDDTWMPTKLATQVAYLEAHPRVVACTVPWSKSTDPRTPVFDRRAVCGDDGVIDRPLRRIAEQQNILISSAVMFDRARAGDLRMVTDRRCTEDLAWQFSLFGRGPFGVAGEEILMVYRLHALNFSRDAMRYYHGLPMLRRMEAAGAFDELGPAGRADLRLVLAQIGRHSLRVLSGSGHRREAVGLYFSELRHLLAAGFVGFALKFPVAFVMPDAYLRRHFDMSATV